MKKTALITLTTLVLILGPAVYFLSSPDRQVTETFSTFSFKNDAVERPTVGEGEEGGYGVSGDIEEIEEPEEEGWFTRWRNSRDDTTDEPEESSGGGSDAGSEDTEATSGTLAQGGTTGTEAPATGNTDTSAPVTTTPATPKSYTLTVTSPTGGSVLSNKICPTSSDTTCYERPIATVFWTYGDLSAKITIELHNESGLVRTLATKTGNSGRYTWNPSLTLQDGNYKLIVRAYSSSGALLTSAETGYFEVSKVKEEEIAPLTSPSSPSTLPAVDWTYETPQPTSYARQNVYPGAPLKITNGEQAFFENPGPYVASLRFVFSQEYESGMIQVVEIPGLTTNTYDVWISRTPGGEPLFEKKTFNGLGGPVDFVHPSVALDGTRAANGWKLDHGTYYYNLDPTDPTGSSVAMTLRRPADWYSAVSSGVSKKTPLVCTELTKDLERGDSDAEVKKLQEFLNATGFTVAVLFGPGAPGEETTDFDEKTEIAVERFQMRYGIAQTGAVGPTTRAKIEALSCGTGSSSGSKSVTSSSCTTSADATVDATKQGGGQYFFSLTGTKSTAVKFKPEYDFGGGNVKYFGQVGAITTPGNNVSKMIQLVVSECPGDFTKKASANGICTRYGVEGGGNVSFGTQTSSNQGLNLCGPLDKTKTYYANVRYVDPSTGQTTCDPAYGQCNTVVGITYGNP